MRIAVFGIGGVGGYFGGRLAQTEHEVIFIARGDHLKAIRSNGLKVSSEQGDFVAIPTLATDDPSEVGIVDAIIVATKAWQVQDAGQAMLPMIGDNTFVVPLLNGVEAPSQLAEIMGEKHVLGGFCRVLSHKEAHGHIIQGGTSPFVAFGELDNRESERVIALREVFTEAGVNIQTTPDIQVAMWQKLLFIASFSGVGAVTRSPAGVLRSVPEAYQMLQDAMTEVFNVARKRDIHLPDDAVEAGLAIIQRLPEDSLASMQRDVMNGYPSELEAQNGAVVRLGAEVDVDTPTHRFIYNSLLPSELRARNQL